MTNQPLLVMHQAHNEKIIEFHNFLFHLQLPGGVKLENLQLQNHF